MLHCRISRPVASCLLAALALLGGCSKSNEAAREQREARAHARAGAQAANERQAAAGAAADDLVAAVSGTDSSAPVSLRFKLAEQPRVGQILRLQLALAQAPGLEIDAMHVSLLPREGLDVKSMHTIDYIGPTTGATQQIQVDVLPTQTGVLGLAVNVLVDGAGGSVVRSFTIPLIAIEPQS
jgi:hypothetical protein